MMKFFTKRIEIPLSSVVLAFLILGLTFTSIAYSQKTVVNPKMDALLASLIVGLFVALVQFLIQYKDFIANEKLGKLRIIDVLIHRDDRNFYQQFIQKSRKQIDVLGMSGSQLLENFADISEDAPENSRIMLTRMTNGVKVRILMPNPECLTTEDEKRKSRAARALYKKIRYKYSSTFEVRYFNRPPAHSIFRVDDQSIIGPIFPAVQVRHTPATVFSNSSPLVQKYLKYFDNEWDESNDILG